MEIRKIQLEIEAIFWGEDNTKDVINFLLRDGTVDISEEDGEVYRIGFVSGVAFKGMWIVRFPNRERFMLNPIAFAHLIGEDWEKYMEGEK